MHCQSLLYFFVNIDFTWNSNREPEHCLVDLLFPIENSIDWSISGAKVVLLEVASNLTSWGGSGLGGSGLGGSGLGGSGLGGGGGVPADTDTLSRLSEGLAASGGCKTSSGFALIFSLTALMEVLLQGTSGACCLAVLVTISILFCWLFTIKDRCEKVRFQQRSTNQGLCPCISVVPEATHEASRGPLKGALSA